MKYSEMISNIINLFKNDKIGNPPWDYYFLKNLDEKEYPMYLSKLFKLNTGEKLPLEWSFKDRKWTINKNKCKTFNQKIQYIKLYGINDLMRGCTDKAKVRDFIRESIGAKYLKPVLRICNSFDEINFDKLPNSFVIKCNHGCKWHYIIKNKEKYLKNKLLIDLTRQNITGWLEQDYGFWGGFELQYRNIEHKILIEPLLREEINTPVREIEVYCFNGKPKIFINVQYGVKREICYYDESFNFIDLILHPDGKNIIKKEKADNLLNQTNELSIKLSKNFCFVRVDWLVFKNKLYFNELTFTPYSGFIKFDKKWNIKLGTRINLGDR